MNYLAAAIWNLDKWRDTEGARARDHLKKAKIYTLISIAESLREISQAMKDGANEREVGRLDTDEGAH